MTTVIEGFLLQAVSEVSLLWFLFYVASAGGIRALSDEAQDYRVVTVVTETRETSRGFDNEFLCSGIAKYMHFAC
jgi:hypothetical protein